MPKGGSRPGNPNGRRGGARPGAGGLKRNVHLSKPVAQELRILTMRRRALTDNPQWDEDAMANEAIHRMWCEFDAAIDAAGEAE